MGKYATYQEFIKLLTLVTENNIKGTVNIFLYVLNTYVESLGYDIINLNLVKSFPEKGIFCCKVTNEVNIIFTLHDNYENYDKKDKIWVKVDVDTASITVKFNVLGKWRTSFIVNLLEEDGEETFDLIKKYTNQKELKTNLEKYGEKFLYDGALTYELIDKELNNDFVKDILQEEIKDPSDNWIKVISEGLANKYSLNGSDQVFHMLKSVMENGLADILEIKGEKEDNKNKIKENKHVKIEKKVDKKEESINMDNDGYADLNDFKARLNRYK